MAGEWKQLRKEAVAELAHGLSAHGFKRRGLDFYRITDYGKELIGISIVSYRGLGFDVDVSVAVRHESVARLVNMFCTSLLAEYAQWTWTVGGNAGDVLGRNTSREWAVGGSPHMLAALDASGWNGTIWPIRDPGDVAIIVAGILSMIQSKALPFFERFSSLEAVISVLAGDDDESRNYLAWDVARAKNAVAAAYVLRDRGRFDQLVQRKTDHLRDIARHSSMAEIQLPNFLNLVSYLEENWESRPQ